MNQYVFLLHERPADYVDMSPAQMQETLARYKAWAGGLAQRGLLVGSEKLADDGGRQLRLSGGKPLATDGPYAETHEVIGGFFVVKAASYAEAEVLAQSCPHLRGTQWIEIRQIDPT